VAPESTSLFDGDGCISSVTERKGSQIRRRRRLGQHLLKDSEILDRIVEAAGAMNDAIVFEIGTGEGDLTARLCRQAYQVISTEIDRSLFELTAMRLRGYQNLELVPRDGFAVDRYFDVVVSNIPYSKSRRFIEWLVEKRPKRAVVTVQKEFGNKILAKPGSRQYRPVSVLARIFFQIDPLFDVKREAFDPPPHVDSTVLLFQSIRTKPVDRRVVTVLKTLFSFRGKQVSSAMKHLLKGEVEFRHFQESYGEAVMWKRVECLSVEEAMRLAECLARFSA
jgi:16S rRNA (adenine1518-N6/adenine1519-N6)-dimethyltransferase